MSTVTSRRAERGSPGKQQALLGAQTSQGETCVWGGVPVEHWRSYRIRGERQPWGMTGVLTGRDGHRVGSYAGMVGAGGGPCGSV